MYVYTILVIWWNRSCLLSTLNWSPPRSAASFLLPSICIIWTHLLHTYKKAPNYVSWIAKMSVSVRSLMCATFQNGFMSSCKKRRAVVAAITSSLLLRNVINWIKSTFWLIGALILSVILPLKTIVAYNIKIFKNDTLYNRYYQHLTIFCGAPNFIIWKNLVGMSFVSWRHWSCVWKQRIT